MSMTRLSFTYPTEQKEALKNIAKKEERNISQLVRIFISEGIKRRIKNKRMTKRR